MYMATPRTWLGRAQEIIDVLSKIKVDSVDRDRIEELFQLQRRAALNLMKQVGVFVAGGRSYVKRTLLIEWVRKIDREEGSLAAANEDSRREFSQAVAEIQATREILTAAGKPPISFPLTHEILESSFAALPPGIELRPGRIEVAFNPEGGPEEVVEKLYRLAKAIANEPDIFERLVLVRSKPPVDEMAELFATLLQ